MLVWESVEGTKSTTNRIIFDIMIGKNIKGGLLKAIYRLRTPSQPLNKKQDQTQGGFFACGCIGGWRRFECPSNGCEEKSDKLSTNEQNRSAGGPQHQVSWTVSAHIECLFDPK